MGEAADLVNLDPGEVFVTPERIKDGAVVALGPFPRHSEKNARTHALEFIVSGIGTEIIHVVANLVGDPEVLRVALEHPGDLVELTGVGSAQFQSHLKSRRCLLAENLEDLLRIERLGIARPDEFGSLAAAKLALPAGGDEEHLSLSRVGRSAFADEAVAFSDEQVSRIQRHRDPVLGIQGGLVVPAVILVLDVIVDERGLVEKFGREGNLFDVLGERIAAVFAQRFEGGDGEERTPAFSVTGEPFAGDILLPALGRPHHGGDAFGSEPAFDLFMKSGEIETTGVIVTGEVEIFPDPVDIDGRVDAVILQQRHGDRRDRRRLDVGESALKHGETRNPDDGLDLAGLNQRHDDGGAFRHEDGITESLGFVLKILDRAKSALLAEQAELVKGRRAFVLDAQALRHEEKAALVRDLGERLAPHFVVETDGGVMQIGLVPFVSQLGENAARMHVELLERHGRDGIGYGDVVADRAEKKVTLLLRLGDVLLRRTETGRGDGDRLGNLDRLNGIDWGGHLRVSDSRGLGLRLNRVRSPVAAAHFTTEKRPEK